jgi:hypothetical protein
LDISIDKIERRLHVAVSAEIMVNRCVQVVECGTVLQLGMQPFEP